MPIMCPYGKDMPHDANSHHFMVDCLLLHENKNFGFSTEIADKVVK